MVACLFTLFTVARAGDVELGLGLRQALEEPGTLDAARLLGRYNLGGWALEGALSVRNPLAAAYSDLDVTLVQIAEYGGSGVAFQAPVEYDRLALTLLADVGFVERAGPGWSGGLRVYGGLEARLVQRTALQYDAEAADAGLDPVVIVEQDPRFQAPLLVSGFGLDAWGAGRVGVRLSVLSRLGWEKDPDYTADDVGDEELVSALHTETGFALDLLFRL